MIKKVEEADSKSQHEESWKLINEISGRKTSKKGILNFKSQEERFKGWYIHFSNLLGKEPVTNNAGEEEITTVRHQLNIKTGPFTVKEYQAVKRKLKEDKTMGSDGILTEAYKHCDFDDIIVKYANKLLIDQEKPDQWSDIHIIPLPKSGDLSKVENYRGIGISSTASKVINQMILNRLQPAIEKQLRPNQNGFRPNRSTSSHILALHRIIEGVKQNIPAVITFVDFQKAFNSVHRAKMMKILSAYGIPDELVKAISLLYENTWEKILSLYRDTEFFDTLGGVLQGDALAPNLFAIVIDYTMRQAVGDQELDLGFRLDKRRSRRRQPITITDLDFADDIALLSEEIQKAQELLTRVENEAAKIDLCLNNEKTEVMVYNILTPSPLKIIGGNAIKIVENFKYLGSWMRSSEQDIKVRKALTWDACHKLNRVWSSPLKRNIKVRLFLATIESVILYGSNTWTLTKKLEQQLDGTCTRMLRKALNVSWRQHMTNEELYKNLQNVSKKIAERRLRLAGHCLRHPEEIASHLVLWQTTFGNTSRGRKATTFINTLNIGRSIII